VIAKIALIFPTCAIRDLASDRTEIDRDDAAVVDNGWRRAALRCKSLSNAFSPRGARLDGGRICKTREQKERNSRLVR
jgi:hypothetical protein